MDLSRLWSLASDPKQTTWIAPLLFLGDAVLSNLVVWKIPCETYLALQQ